jgi:hypothetical protein
MEQKHDYKATVKEQIASKRRTNCRICGTKIWGPWNKTKATKGTKLVKGIN